MTRLGQVLIEATPNNVLILSYVHSYILVFAHIQTLLCYVQGVPLVRQSTELLISGQDAMPVK